MPYWMVKAAVQGMMSFLPKSQFWNHFFQQYITKSLDLDYSGFESKLSQCRKHLQNYFDVSPKGRMQFSAMELGTGWYPIVPVGLYLCGASKIYTFDLISLLNSTRIRNTLHFFVEYAVREELCEELPMLHKDRISVLRNVLENSQLMTPAEILGRLNIFQKICDASQTAIEKGSIDLFVSNNTLEHIPHHDLIAIFTESRQLASSQAVMSHFIDMQDHYSNFDRSITPYNFLKYPSAVWKIFNNSLQYQNRLRISDYREIHHFTGWKVVNEQNDMGASEEIAKICIAKDFQHYSEKDLLVKATFITSQANGPNQLMNTKAGYLKNE